MNLLSVIPWDAGTQLHVSGVAPNRDQAWWSEINMEEQANENNIEVINMRMVSNFGETTVRPWRLPVSNLAFIDRSGRNDGIDFKVYCRNPLGDGENEWYEPAIAEGLIYQPTDYYTTGAKSLMETLKSSEVSADSGEGWMMLPMYNETGNCQLDRALNLTWCGLHGRALLSVGDNPLFAPFDLRHPERYQVLGSDGKMIANDSRELMSLVHCNTNQRVHLILRPRRWWYYAWVLAHFEYISIFEEVPNDEQFLIVFYDRPPFYPFRFDASSAFEPFIEHAYWGGLLCYDAGIEYKFQWSQAGAFLGSQILEQQYYSLCIVYVYLNCEPAVVTIKKYPPRYGEIVGGIAIVDDHTQRRDVLWLRQIQDLSSVYPQETLGEFWCYFDPLGASERYY